MVSVRALGAAQIDAGELRITPLSVRKFALLLRLTAEPGRMVPRSVLRELVFPDLAEANARHSLRDLAYQFRQAGVTLQSDNEGIALPENAVSADYDHLIRLRDPGLARLRAAQGGLLPGYAPEHSEAFTEWLSAYRARLTLEICRGLSETIARAKSVGDWMTTEHAARACLEFDPTHEGATLGLAETLAVSGSKAQAVALLDNYVRELGPSRSGLHVPAAVVRRRISERVRDNYRRDLTLPFLGRDSEMLLLRERFELARGGESQCVVIVGDAGIGKSRLGEEFCTQAALQGARVEHVATQPHDTHRPMATFADLVPRLLKLPGALGCSPESMTALKRLTSHEGEGDAPQPETVPSDAVASAISRAIADIVDAIATETTLVLVVDDVQWSDELSRRALVALASAKVHRRLLVLLTSRDRGTYKLFAERADRVVGVHLAPLRRESLREILLRLLAPGTAEVDGQLAEWMATSSGGNPFFLRCLVTHFLTSGERFSVPTSLSLLLDRLVASLSEEARALLGMCVALARHASVERLMLALELPYSIVQSAVRELELSHLIVSNDRNVEAAHWLVAETIARASTPISLQLTHRRVATILEREAQDAGVPAQFWDCAEHWILANEPARAAQAMRRCSMHSLKIGRPREASEVLLRAATMSSGHERVALATEAVQIADAAGELDLLRRGADIVQSCGGAIEYDGFEIATAFVRVAEMDYGPDFREQLLSWVKHRTSIRHRLTAGIAALILADQDAIPELGTQVFEILSSVLPAPQKTADLLALKFLLIYHSSFGDRDASLDIAHRALVHANELEPAVAAGIQRLAAVALLRAGLVDEARAVFGRGYANARESGLLRLQLIIASMLAALAFDLGDDSGSTNWLSIADALATQIGDSRANHVYLVLLADVECTRGTAASARRAFEAVAASVSKKRGPRVGRWLRALEIRIRQLDRQALDVDWALKELIGHHVRGAELGDLSDFEVGVAIHVLLEADRIGEAREILNAYLRDFRRSGSPLSRILAIGAERLCDSERIAPVSSAATPVHKQIQS